MSRSSVACQPGGAKRRVLRPVQQIDTPAAGALLDAGPGTIRVCVGFGELSRAKLSLGDHALVPVHLALDPVLRSIAFSEEQTNDLIAAFDGMLDAAVGEKLHCLPRLSICVLTY